MVSGKPQARFEPIAPSFDLNKLVEEQENFQWAVRIHCDMIEHHGLDSFDKLILVHVILGGRPLVIEGYERRLDKWTFAVQWLRDNYGSKIVDIRELNKGQNVPMTTEHYLRHMPILTNQWDDSNYKDERRQRMYLKDMDCPQIWHEKVRDHMPFGMFYMNESTGEIDGFGAVDEQNPSGPGMRRGRGVAKAGDLMSSLPKEMRAENLMCYIGHEGTYTPSHREMCATLGHNIMVEASSTAIEDGKLTKPGSSIWFMTETKQRHVVSEYWLSRLGHDIEIEKHFAQINAWKRAPFNVYVVHQKPGDFIIIPPMAPHQVWNRGTRTMKVAWNRTTIETLELAFEEALPKARMVCRDEQYKNKAIVYYTLQKYSNILQIADKHKRAGIRGHQSDIKVRQLEKDFKRLHSLFTQTLMSESFLSDRPEKKVELIPFEGNVICSYCRCNIFNRFLTCPSCVIKTPDGDADAYDICMECYTMGRSCACISKLRWVEQFPWKELVANHDRWRLQIIEAEGMITEKTPSSLKTEMMFLGSKRTLAQICQIELTKRPWRDITKDEAAGHDGNENEADEEDVELDANGKAKKKPKQRKSAKFLRDHGRCHIDCHWEPKWKQATCSKCDKNYCYGNLFRAYDMMPQDVLANPDWQCPSCQKICRCRHCRNKPGFKQYLPKATFPGHDTKKVADVRSVESLVDFSHDNLSWISKAGDDHNEDSVRMGRRVRAAEAAQALEPQLGDHYVDTGPTDDNLEARILHLAVQEGIPIDPALAEMPTPSGGDVTEDDDAIVEHPEEPSRKPDDASGDVSAYPSLLPEGGVIWDNEHAYEPTDAITFSYYPEPDAAPQLPPAPAEGYTPVVVPGYEPAAPNGYDDIEMVGRKRKRAKIDEEDKPYYGNLSQPKTKSKKRKSLVVKLSVDKDKLAEIDKTASIAQKALTWTAPVVSSDLQALNVSYHGLQGEPPIRKERTAEQAEDDDDVDDDFTPARYRDRRKPALDGTTLPARDADITRRSTRMHAVTYADPSDGEGDSTEVDADGLAQSKLATMTKAIDGVDALLVSTEDPVQSLSGRSISPEAPTQRGSSILRADTHRGPQATSLGVTLDRSHRGPGVVQTCKNVPRPTSSSDTSVSATSFPAVPSKVVAEAQANRRAKLAVIEGMVGDNNGESEDASSDSSSSDAESSLENSPPASTAVRKPTVGSKAPKLSLPSTIVLPENMASPKPSPKPPARAVAAPKVSVADWGDDSSDEELTLATNHSTSRTGSGFVAVNMNRISNHVSTPSGRGRGKGKRGRPYKIR